MAWSTEISQLVTETEQFIDAVELKKIVLDTAANTALQNATAASLAANTAIISASLSPSVDISKGHVVATEAIANLTKMQQDAVSDTERQASLAAGYALSTGTIVQQDLTGVTAAALHRSPNAITSLFVYDTSKDSDGGAWTEKCQNTSWYNEDITGGWLGPQSSELYARHFKATLGTELVTNGNFDTNVSGWTSAGCTLSWNNKVLRITDTDGGIGYADQAITLVVGKFYKATADIITDSITGNMIFQVGTSEGSGQMGSTTLASGTGSVELVFQATATTGRLNFRNTTSVAGEYWEVDNVSVKEVIALNTVSNDYFQLTTDGKFYRLWKNLLTRTEEFNDSIWTKSGVTLTATSNPQEWYLANDGVGSASSITQNFSIFTNAVFSIEMKADTIRYIRLRYLNVTNTSIINVDLQTGTSDGAAVLVTLLSDGFYRISLPFISGADNNGLISIGISDVLDNAAIAPSASKRIIIRKPQLEYGSTATTYEAKTTLGTTSEVFRGNKRDFPRLAAIVAEGANVNIYDLTESGRPMWMRFTNGTNTFLGWATPTTVTSSVTALVGRIAIGTGSHGQILDFANDNCSIAYGSGTLFYEHINRRISSRQANGGFRTTTGAGFGYIIGNGTVNAVAMTVLPDAPIDAVTGLKIPTIAIGTNGGISVIQDEGITRNGSGLNNVVSVAITPLVVYAGRSDGTLYYVNNPGTLGDSFASLSRAETVAPGFAIGGTGSSKVLTIPRAGLLRLASSYSRVQMIYRNTIDIARSIMTTITNAFNTGWTVGDVRRAYLSDTILLPATETELVAYPDMSAVNVGWTENRGGTLVYDGNGLLVTNTTAFGGGLNIPLTLYNGDALRITMDIEASGTGGIYGGGVVSGFVFYNTVAGRTQVTVDTIITFANPTVIFFIINGNQTLRVRYLSIKRLSPDRSYKKALASINGTLTRTQVASGASLVGYSGFSAANYLREPYSADLDFGTGEFSASAWLNTSIGRRNILTRTEEFNNSAWTKLGITISPTQYLAPDGTTTADLATTNNGAQTNVQLYQDLVTGQVSTAMTISAFVKKSGANFAAIGWIYASGIYCAASFNLNTATLSRSDAAGGFTIIGTPTITAVAGADGWYRISITATTSSNIQYSRFPGVWPRMVEWTTLTPDAGDTGNGTDGILIWGAQLELGSTATSYQKVVTGSEIMSPIFDRAHSLGPRIRMGINGLSQLTAEAFDGTSTRTVTTTAAYNNAQWLKAEVNYTTDGSLAIQVNGREVAVTRGNPLLTLNSRRNLLTWSEDFSNAIWTKANTTITGGQSDRNSLTTAFVSETTVASNPYVRQTYSAAAGNHTFSIYAKYFNTQWLSVTFNGITASAWFDMQNGVSGTGIGANYISHSISPSTNGYYRLSITVNVPSAVLIYPLVRPANDNNTSATTIGQKIYIAEAQLELGNTATEYQRVTTVAETNVAPLTIGNSYALDAPFPGSITMLKLGATVPTAEQSTFMYEQEKRLFRADAISVLPDGNMLVDMAYDDATDRWSTVSTTNESYWTGLVRSSVTPVPAGSYSKIDTTSGIELSSRITTSPGVDVSIPTYLLSEDLNKRAEAASKAFKEIVNFDYVGGFTASTTTGSTAITSVANLTYPVSSVGARISGTGIPTNATIVAVVGTTIYISAAATATATGVSISFLDFRLPTGFEAETVATAGAIRREGTTADFTRFFDGFLETIRFAVAPGVTTWVQIQASRIIS